MSLLAARLLYGDTASALVDGQQADEGRERGMHLRGLQGSHLPILSETVCPWVKAMSTSFQKSPSAFLTPRFPPHPCFPRRLGFTQLRT